MSELAERGVQELANEFLELWNKGLEESKGKFNVKYVCSDDSIQLEALYKAIDILAAQERNRCVNFERRDGMIYYDITLFK